MIVEHATSRVDALVGRYARFGIELLGAASEAIDDPQVTSPIARTRLINKIVAAQISFVEDSGKSLDAFTWEVFKQALRDATYDLSDPLGLSIKAEASKRMEDFVRVELRNVSEALIDQSERDGRSVVRFQETFAIQVDLLLQSGKHSQKSAQVATRIKNGLPEQVYLDRAGRHWKGERYVRTLVHAHLFNIYNETFMMAMLMLNENIAQVSGGRLDGVRFWISEPVSELSGYHEIRPIAFHPGSKAVVVAV